MDLSVIVFVFCFPVLSVALFWSRFLCLRHYSFMASEENTELDPEQIELPAYPPTGWWGKTYRKLEQKLSKLCFENNLWYKILTSIYLPLAAKAGMKLGKRNGEVYEAVLPFKKFNKNWYDAMAGAALLANTEIAGGMAIFQYVDIEMLMKTKPEFNLRMEIDVLAEMKNKMRKIGTSKVTFHIAAKSLMAQRIFKAKQKAKA